MQDGGNNEHEPRKKNPQRINMHLSWKGS